MRSASQKLRGAGAIVIGKLSTHEFAIGGPSFDLPWPPARNPVEPRPSSRRLVVGLGRRAWPPGCSRWRWAPTPAAACAIRPAACGIVGLKPTYGLVSRRGVFPLSFTLDHVGPMTRTVADNALMLEAIAGHDPLDPGSAAAPDGHYAAGARSRRARTCASASCGISTRSTCRPIPR